MARKPSRIRRTFTLFLEGKAPQRNPLQGLDLASGAERDRTGDPLLAKPSRAVGKRQPSLILLE